MYRWIDINDRNYRRQRGAREFGLVKIEDNLETQRGEKVVDNCKNNWSANRDVNIFGSTTVCLIELMIITD